MPSRTAQLLTTGFHLFALVAGVVLAVVWFAGLVPAWGGAAAWGFRDDLVIEGGVLYFVARYAALAYVYGGWAVFPVGFVLMLLAWTSHALGRGKAVAHWISRVANLSAVGLFCLPLLLLAVEILSTVLAVKMGPPGG